MPRLIFAFFIMCLTLTVPAQAQDGGQFPGVKGLMSAQEYEDSGLGKLAPEELKALDKWLIEYTAWEAAEIKATVEEVKEVEKEFEITANIKQPFKGWSSKTYFYLDNGQVWQQRSSGRYYYSGDETAVTIRKNVLGFYSMTLVATGKEVGVKRVK